MGIGLSILFLRLWTKIMHLCQVLINLNKTIKDKHHLDFLKYIKFISTTIYYFKEYQQTSQKDTYQSPFHTITNQSKKYKNTKIKWYG